ncbi:hypothetical protein SDC9_07728 [bioreactor metagenome]|uniref:Phosphatidic acid phosphatase type 2/haloperoxidase domain-containing protein n=1 Tax=bioreactor metagenome TaxID=1076179 RepID=A0A644T6K8_9ZZZZ|nr:phosphatase PAP2 family protein [Candidatus Elulimicrobiales bacterium]
MDSFLFSFFKAVSFFGNEMALIVLITLISLILLFSYNKKKLSAFILFNYLITIGTVIILKYIIQKPRSLLALVEEKTYAFPSGHVALATTTFLLLFFIAKYVKNKFWKIFLEIFAIFWLVSTIFARLYLKVHDWPDIVTSIFLAVFIFILALTIPSFKKSFLAKEIKK